jgi:hypothetical protein
MLPERRRLGVAALCGASMLLTTGGADASLTIDHISGADGCTEAATYFPEDEGPLARNARLRCRLEAFAQQREEERRRGEAAGDREREKTIETWIEKQEIPVRVLRRNSVDLFLSGGVASYGLALGGVLLPWLEGELWAGRRSVADSVPSGYLSDARTCLGGRFKWLFVKRGNLTPLVSLGAVGCSSDVQFQSYGATPTGGPIFLGDSANPNLGSTGQAVGHLATATAGLTWTEKAGLRISVEYLFAYAFYTQATLNDAAKTEDPNLRTAWEQRLTADRHGVRLQVGYAF